MKLAGRTFKDAVYTQLARVGRALASPQRLEILDLLSQGPMTVETLARETGQSAANTSHHLQALRSARLVGAEKRGLYVTYRLADSEVETFFGSLRRLAESRLAEIERVTGEYLESSGAMESVDQVELVRRVKRGEATVIDVRPAGEYRAGHIPGAISVPLGELKRRLRDFPRRKEVVAYCRGPYCVLAIKAVEMLRAHGIKAHRLADGVPDWKARGFKVAMADGSI